MNGLVAARLIPIAAALVLAASPTSAQVAIKQTGQALDFNFQVGSGGYNSVAGGIGGVNSQLYVNGQVSGLGNFRGSVGYYAPNQLNLNLPGAGVSNFRQQSVGLRDILGGNTYAPTPYYDRSTTLWGMPGIAPSAATPATTSPLPPMPAAPLPAPPGWESTFLYRPLSAGPFTGSGALPGFEGRVGPAPQWAPKPGEGGPAGAPSIQLPPTSVNPTTRQQLLRALAEPSDRPQQEVDSQVKSEFRTDIDSVRPIPPLEEKTATMKEQGAGQPEEVPASETPAPLGVERLRDISLPQPNQDIYLDILVHMQRQRAKPKRPSAVEPSETSPAQAQAAAGEKPQKGQGRKPVPPPPLVDQAARAAAPQPPRNVVEYSPKTGIVLHGLAGQNRDQFNLRMAAAEKDLKEGRYAQAATSYSLAIALDPENPLARIGQGICSFAKGEHLSSSVHIRRAINLFPPIARTRLDLPAMVDGGVLKRQIVALDNRLSASRLALFDPGLLFAGAYVHYNLGNIDQARQHARKLLSVPGADKAFTDFAAFVLSDQPAAQPAPSAQPTPSAQPAPTTRPMAP